VYRFLEQTVDGYMTRNVRTVKRIYVSPDTRLTRVLQIMVEHRIRSIIVLDGAQKLVGIIARQDVIAALKATARD
jgi:CBS domain-containing protein